jgi:hypothetical protein
VRLCQSLPEKFLSRAAMLRRAWLRLLVPHREVGFLHLWAFEADYTEALQPILQLCS